MQQLPMFQPECSWTPTPVSQLPSWADAKRVAIDIETRDPHLKKLGPGVRRGAYIVGVSFSIEDGPSFYLPIRHGGGGNLPVEQVLAYLREQARVFKGVLVGANLQYDLDFLAHEGIEFKNAQWIRDIQIAEPLIDELHYSYGMDAIAERHGLVGKQDQVLVDAASAWGVDPKKGLADLPAKFAAQYAIVDCELPLKILRKQERIIEEDDLWDIYNLESRLLPVLLKMRRKGVRIDTNQLQKVEDWSIQQEELELRKVKALTGIHIAVGDVNRKEPIVAVLQQLGIKCGTTATGQPKVDQAFLNAQKHPALTAYLQARKVNKLRTTFAQSVRDHMVNGRIHATFNQLRRSEDDDEGGDDVGGRYGRLSCVDPNLQQQPSRDEFAKFWRSIYLPDEGKVWASLDYSQQEPRMLIHYAELMNLPRAREAAEKYRTDPNTDNHQMMAEMADIERKKAKIIFLGLCYSMGGAKLCDGLSLPTKYIISKRTGKNIRVAGPEGEILLKKFDDKLPFIKMLARKCEDKAKRTGYIKTVLGRRCRFPKKEDGTYDWCHKALNRLIQGSSADQTKKAMVDGDAAGIEIQLQIHDEVVPCVSSRQEAEAMADIMRTCVPLNVPSKVDIEIGTSWGGSMGYVE